jgi:hypothetical protein
MIRPELISSLPERDMALSKLQRKVLERYKLSRDQPPTVRGSLETMLVSHIALIMFLTVLTVVGSVMTGGIYLGIFVVGLGVGAFARDIGWIRRTVQYWPILATVIDWQKVDTLLESDEESSSTGSKGG